VWTLTHTDFLLPTHKLLVVRRVWSETLLLKSLTRVERQKALGLK